MDDRPVVITYPEWAKPSQPTVGDTLMTMLNLSIWLLFFILVLLALTYVAAHGVKMFRRIASEDSPAEIDDRD